jgi:hypothetical protein
VLRVLFMVECDHCNQLLPYTSSTSDIDTEQWEGLAYELPQYSQRYLGWRAYDNEHICPVCLSEMGELDEESVLNSEFLK